MKGQTKFKYFNSDATILNVINMAIKENKLSCYFWFNNFCDISGLQPDTCDIYLTKNADSKLTAWYEEMMDWPFLRIRITLNCVAVGCNGFPGIVGNDSIRLTYFKGVDFSRYKAAEEAWNKDGHTGYINAEITCGEILHEYKFPQDKLYELEEKLYNSIQDGTILELIDKSWELLNILNSIDSELAPA